MSSRGRTASPRRKTGASPARAKAASPARATSPRRGRPPKSVTADAAAPAVAAPAASATHAASPAKVDHHKRVAHVEFGGPVGTALIMIFSHVLLYYVYYVLRVNKGNMWFPTSVADLRDVVAATAEATAPTLFDFTIYLSFILVEAIFAMVMPGLEMRGRPDASGSVLTYRCNAYLSWFATLGGLFLLHWTGFFPLQTIFNRSGRLMTVAVIFADSLSAVLYIHAFTSGTTFRMMGNHVYDFFMGASLHPRIGVLDIKMFAEIRMSWFLLFVLTISAAAQQWAEDKVISSPMWLLIYAHFLYANACAKGEHYVPATWDISYEKFGWMLCFWNFAGVPFLYCKQSVYLALKLGAPLQSPYVIGFLLVVLTAAYYVWDTAQSQKNHFRLQFSGVTIHRNTQPQLPWRTLDNPMYLTTAKGTPLLIDGWWAYARKIHYTCDVVMALCWALTCGFQHFIPYLYVAFFVSMITHRYQRDVAKCAREYGADWDRYVEVVPYTFIPGLI